MRARPIAVGALVATALALGVAIRSEAATVEHLNLSEIVDRADRIVRGTVISADESRVAAGGGLLPIVIYRIRVAEVVKGAVAGDVLEIRLLSAGKGATRQSREVSLFRDLPQFRVGQEYLLALTRPSAVGLSTTVGLGQGTFELRGAAGREEAVNQLNNLGLLDESTPAAGAAAAAPGARTAGPAVQAAPSSRASGPMAYGTLVNEIRARMAR